MRLWNIFYKIYYIYITYVFSVKKKVGVELKGFRTL